MNKKVLAKAAAVLTMTIWGFSFMFSKKAFEFTDPITLLAYRFVVAFVLIHLAKMLLRIRFDLKGKPVQYLLILGIIQPIIYYLCENYGMLYSSTTFTGVMIALIPIAALIGGAVFLKEIPSAVQIIGSAVSVGGVIVLSVTPGTEKIATARGAVLMTVAVIAAASFMLLSKGISGMFSTFERTYFVFAESGAFYLLLALFRTKFNFRALAQPLAEKSFVTSVAFLGVMASFVCYFLQNFYVARMSVAEASVLANLSTVVTIITGIMILGEPLTAKTIPCTVAIIAGVIVVQLASLRKEEGIFS